MVIKETGPLSSMPGWFNENERNEAFLVLMILFIEGALQIEQLLPLYALFDELRVQRVRTTSLRG